MKKILTLLIVVFMFFTSILTAGPILAEEDENGDDNAAVTWEVVENKENASQRLKSVDRKKDSSSVKTTGDVRVSIVLEKASTLEAGYKTEDIALNKAAVSYRDSLKKDQDDISSRISKEVLGGESLDVVWNLTLAANIISANVPADKIDEIRKMEGVKNVVIELQYYPEEDEISDPNMTTSTEMTYAQDAWSAGYTGAGSLVAIVDTGLDVDHQSFDPYSFEFAIEQIERKEGEKVDLLEDKEVRRFWDMLNAAQFQEYSAQSYVNTKVPYAFNYVDGDYDIIHANDNQGEHGSHVASIAAGNKYVYVEDEDGASFKNAKNYVHTLGNAPDAQILVMKVFGKGGGAYDSDYFAAIEDAIVLGADSVNLSLGSSVAGFSYNATYNELIESLKNVNIVWANSAGNNSSWGGNLDQGYIYADGANFQTGGSPATYYSTLSVASVDNYGFTGPTVVVDGNDIYYTETSGKNEELRTIAGEYSYIYIDSFGTANEFAAVADELEGKIAVCNRGSISFYVKAENAVANGAIATIIANNQPGTISMDLSSYTKTQPCVSITRADGDLLLSAAEEKETSNGQKYYEGKITVVENITTKRSDSDYYTMSSFSSFGVPGTLSMKPEITAPGGNIYAAFGYSRDNNGNYSGGSDKYENMSGTSMASPQIAGIAATMAEYVKENDLDKVAERYGITRRALIQSLLMSTATPIKEERSGNYYSILNQGSGLVNVKEAINSRVFLLMESTSVGGETRKDISYYANDGKVKAELGDDPNRTGNYTIQFSINNMTDEERYFDLDSSFFTQGIFEYDGIKYLNTSTESLSSVVSWYLNGDLYVPEVTFDFNGDDVFDDKDAQALLDYVTGVRTSIYDEDEADLDNDGDIDTYDAYLALKLSNRADTVVPANGSVDVTAVVSLGDIDSYDNNGAYVEGYLFATEQESKDGAYGVEHSIPVLGYYGGWSEPSMIDVGSYLEYSYGLEDRAPYMASSNALSNDAYSSQSFIAYHSALGLEYYFGGNPTYAEDVYYPERNALNTKNILEGVMYSQIRNSVGYKFEVLDEDGNILDEIDSIGNVYAAYYYASQGVWNSTNASSGFDLDLSKYPEGTKLSVRFYLAPEYYLDRETGSIDWSEIQPAWEIPFVLDNSDPEVDSVFATRVPVTKEVENEDGSTETVEDSNIVITASVFDNEYIAAVLAYDETDEILYAWGPRDGEKSGKYDREDYVVVLQDANDIPDHIYLEIWDYAANITTIKINLNKDELDDPVEISLDQDYVYAVVGSSTNLTATVSPWGIKDPSVTWSSSDTDIAVVNEDGIVTGLNEGSATITAVANADPSKSASCEFTFVYIERELNGAVWDENGEVWYSLFNTSTLPEYTKLTESRMPTRLSSLTYAEDGIMYGATLDTDDLVSSLYTYDPNTNQTELIGDSPIGYMDLAPAPSLEGNLILAVYGPYIVIVDRESGSYLGVFNLSSYLNGNYLVGIAYEEQYNHPSYGMTDWYFLIDNAGTLYNIGLLNFNGNYANFRPSNYGSLGYSTDSIYFQSLYYDGTDLYWSRYLDRAGTTDIIFVEDLYYVGNVYNLGAFGENVWPVGGLTNSYIFDAMGIDDPNDIHADAQIDEDTHFETEFTPIEVVQSSRIKGGLDSIATANNPIKPVDSAARVKEDEENDDVVIHLMADGAVEQDGIVVSHNGLFTVVYDSEDLTLKSVESDLKYTSLNDEEEGKIVFAFISADGIVDGGTVAKVTFTRNSEEETTITVNTDETESYDPDITDEIVISNVSHPQSVTLNKHDLTLDKEDTYQLTATVLPEDADQSVVWTSSDEEVATVDETGLVTAVGDGEAEISVWTLEGQLTDSCIVTVKTFVKSVALDKTSLTMELDSSDVLKAMIDPEDATNQEVGWSSSDPNVVSVDQKGNIKAEGVGNATITVVTADGGFSATCEITVIVSVTSVSLNKQSLLMNKGDKETLIAKVEPANASDPSVIWYSSDPSVATVDENGTVTAVKSGTAVISAITKRGRLTANCNVTVATPVTGVTLNKNSITLASGSKERLTAAVTPSDATNKGVTWTSSNTAVAKVDSNGNVTAVGIGKAVITVTTNDGKKSAKCTVTVNLAVPELVAIFNSANGADIRFKPVVGATEYVIMKKFNGKWSEVVTVKASALSKDGDNYKYIDGSVKNDYGKGYIYSVKAKNGSSVSDYNKVGLALYRLAQPSFTSGSSPARGTVTLTWKKVDAQGYEVQYSADGGKTWTKAPQTANTSISISGLKSSTEYVFRVRCQKTNKDRGTTWSQYSLWIKIKVK